jgi:hypothetical protein
MTNSVSEMPTGLLRQRIMNVKSARTTECDGLRNIATRGILFCMAGCVLDR